MLSMRYIYIYIVNISVGKAGRNKEKAQDFVDGAHTTIQPAVRVL